MATVPPAIQPMLDDYLQSMNVRLPGFLSGFYLHGSLALGAFDPVRSDIDFLAVVSRPVTPGDVAGLRAVHRLIALDHPLWPMEGSYLQWGDLGQPDAAIRPHPHYHDAVLNPRAQHTTNGVTWWLLKHRGIVILGPSPDQLAIEIDWDDLIAWMHQNMNTYWRGFVSRPQRVAWLLSDYGIQWAVLGVLRQFYTFREHDITSKVGAGIYALDHLPQRWQRIVQEALWIREGARASAYQSRLVRALEAHRFLRYLIAKCQ